MRYSIESKFTFEYGHVLKNAYMTACSDTCHGHSGKVFVKISTDKLNEDGMVADFKKVKEAINPVIEMLDHSFLIAKDDKRLNAMKKNNKKLLVLKEKGFERFNYNPTAEAIAHYLYSVIIIRLPIELGVVNKDFKLSIRFYETEKNCVIVEE